AVPWNRPAEQCSGRGCDHLPSHPGGHGGLGVLSSLLVTPQFSVRWVKRKAGNVYTRTLLYHDDGHGTGTHALWFLYAAPRSRVPDGCSRSSLGLEASTTGMAVDLWVPGCTLQSPLASTSQRERAVDHCKRRYPGLFLGGDGCGLKERQEE